MLAMGLLASCSTDRPDEPGKVLGNETKTFVKISLVSTDGGGTRAEGSEFADDLYETGEDSENLIKKVLLVFYDEAKNYVGNTEITVSETAPDYSGANDDLTIARVLTTVAVVNLPENTNHPAYVMAYVNPTSAASDLVSKEKLASVPYVLREAGSVSPDGMTMNNSVYYDVALGQPQYATHVDFTTQFYKTEEEAAKAPSIDITVERVQAKVRLETNKEDMKVAPFQSNENAEYSLEFVPENWFVNATEKYTFLIKNFRNGETNFLNTSTAAFGDWLSFSELQSRFDASDGRANQINEERRKRSYWALDPTYFFSGNAQYPAISYDVKNGTLANPTAKEFPIRYRSYNQGVAGDWKSYEYCLENTMNLATLKSDRAKASMTSVVLLGHYVVKDSSGKVVFDGASDKGTFFIRHNSDSNKTVLLTEKDVINYFLERTGTLLYYPVAVLDEDGAPTSEVEYQPLRAAHAEKYNLYADFTLAHPSKIDPSILGQSVVSEQWRTLKFANETVLGKYYVYEQLADGTYGYAKLTSAKLSKMLKNMYSAFGLVESFKEGKAFFNVPLKHIFYNASLYDHKNPNSNVLDAENVQLGDYGVVRNHVYSLSINRITGLGSGIGDLNQPIVPPTEVDNYYISAKINVLKWRIVSQSVDL